jgi:hypothetical protein
VGWALDGCVAVLMWGPLQEMPLDIWALDRCVAVILEWPVDDPVCLDVLRVGSRRRWLLFHYSSFRHQIGSI